MVTLRLQNMAKISWQEKQWQSFQPSVTPLCGVPIMIFRGFPWLFDECQTVSRPQWSRGYHTRHWIRGSRVQTRTGSMDFFRT